LVLRAEETTPKGCSLATDDDWVYPVKELLRQRAMCSGSGLIDRVTHWKRGNGLVVFAGTAGS